MTTTVSRTYTVSPPPDVVVPSPTDGTHTATGTGINGRRYDGLGR